MIGRSKQPQLAAIYVRVSSEHQAEKVSLKEQEIECRRLAEEMGLSIISVYRETQKFRVGSRLFEPSGSRTEQNRRLDIEPDRQRQLLGHSGQRKRKWKGNH